MGSKGSWWSLGEILGANSASHTPTVLGNTSVRRAFISTLNDVECKSYSNVVTVTIDTSTPTTAVLNSNREISPFALQKLEQYYLLLIPTHRPQVMIFMSVVS